MNPSKAEAVLFTSRFKVYWLLKLAMCGRDITVGSRKKRSQEPRYHAELKVKLEKSLGNDMREGLASLLGL